MLTRLSELSSINLLIETALIIGHLNGDLRDG
jgi:hypothetical protein